MRPLLLALALAVCLASAGCLSHERASDGDAGVLAYCEPPLYAEPFPPPSLPSPVPPEPATAPPRGVSFSTHVLSPRSFGRAIFLERPEPIELSFEAVHGAELDTTSEWSLRFFVDAAQVDVIAGSVTTPRADLLVTESRATARVTLPAGAVPPGAHTLTILVHRASPAGRPMAFFAGPPWTVFHGSYAWSEAEPTEGGRIEAAVADPSEHAVLRAGSVPFSGELDAPPGGVYRVTLALQPSDARLETCEPPYDVERMALIALLDGGTHPLGGRDRIVAEVPFRSRAVFDVDIEDLPTEGGAEHQLEIFAMHGLASSLLVDPPSAWTMATQAGATAYGAERIALVVWGGSE